MCPARVNMHFKALAAACIIICFHGTSHAVDEVMFLIRILQRRRAVGRWRVPWVEVRRGLHALGPSP